MAERVILVGFMCSGKSTVGRKLADRLGWSFIDFDEEIERVSGKRVIDIFRGGGEAAFRRLEADLTEQLEGRRQVIFAPGGGWMARPELVDRLRPGSLLVWLRVRPETVYRRWQQQPEVGRPLLQVGRPLERIRTLLKQRRPHYEEADIAIDTDPLDVDQIVERIVDRLESDGPRPVGGR